MAIDNTWTESISHNIIETLITEIPRPRNPARTTRRPRSQVGSGRHLPARTQRAISRYSSSKELWMVNLADATKVPVSTSSTSQCRQDSSSSSRKRPFDMSRGFKDPSSCQTLYRRRPIFSNTARSACFTSVKRRPIIPV